MKLPLNLASAVIRCWLSRGINGAWRPLLLLVLVAVWVFLLVVLRPAFVSRCNIGKLLRPLLLFSLPLFPTAIYSDAFRATFSSFLFLFFIFFIFHYFFPAFYCTVLFSSSNLILLYTFRHTSHLKITRVKQYSMKRITSTQSPINMKISNSFQL